MHKFFTTENESYASISNKQNMFKSKFKLFVVQCINQLSEC